MNMENMNMFEKSIEIADLKEEHKLSANQVMILQILCALESYEAETGNRINYETMKKLILNEK